MDIFGPLPKTTQGNYCNVIVTDEFSKLTQAAPIARIKATALMCIFFEEWVLTYGIPPYLITGNGMQFCRPILWHPMYLSRYKTHKKDCLPSIVQQTVKKIKRDARSPSTPLSHHPSTQLRFLGATLASNWQVRQSTNTTPHSLVSRRSSPGPTTFENPAAFAAIACHAKDPQDLQTQLLTCIKTLPSRVRQRLDPAQY